MRLFISALSIGALGICFSVAAKPKIATSRVSAALAKPKSASIRMTIAAAESTLATSGAAVAANGPLSMPFYTTAQAARGAALYKASCKECHGANLDDGQFATPLKGPAFVALWRGQALDAPYDFMVAQMPPTAPASMGAQGYADILAYLLSQNGIVAGAKELPADSSMLKRLAAPH